MEKTISKMTRAVELIQEASEHLEEAMIFISDFFDVEDEEYQDITVTLDTCVTQLSELVEKYKEEED